MNRVENQLKCEVILSDSKSQTFSYESETNNFDIYSWSGLFKTHIND